MARINLDKRGANTLATIMLKTVGTDLCEPDTWPTIANVMMQLEASGELHPYIAQRLAKWTVTPDTGSTERNAGNAAGNAACYTNT